MKESAKPYPSAEPTSAGFPIHEITQTDKTSP